MVGLRDIAPAGEIVVIRGIEVKVEGLDITQIRDLFVAFPDVETIFADGKVSAARVLMAGPALVNSVLKVATASVEAKDIEAIARLKVGDQVALLNAVIRQTMPDGIGPFVALLESVGLGHISLGAATSRGRDTNSPSPSPTSSAADSTSPT